MPSSKLFLCLHVEVFIIRIIRVCANDVRIEKSRVHREKAEALKFRVWF